MAERRGRRGDGTVFQLPDGRWRAQLDLGIVDGKRRRPSRTRATQREARQALRDLRAVDHAAARERVTVAGWVAYWLDNVAAKRVRPATLPGYRSKMELYVLPTIGRVQLDRLTAEHVERCWSAMASRGLAPATIRQTHAILSRCLTVAEQRGKVDRNPCRAVQLEHVEPNPHAMWTPDECRRVLDVTATARERLRVECGVVLAMRPGEVLGLQWRDVHEDDPAMAHLLVAGGLREIPGRGLVLTPPKSSRSRRVIPLPASVARDFAELRRESAGHGFVFSGATPDTPTQPKRDWKAWRELQQRAIPPVPYVTPHGARGSAATLLADLGVPMIVVQAILGHADVTTTARHYAIARDEMAARALDQAAAALLG